jgi:ribonuclease VapC
MVIDTSAVVAILRGEAVAERLELAIEADPVRLLSAASLIECAIVMEARLGDIGGRELDLLIHKGGLDVVAVDAEQAEIARVAYRKFGKGRHPASLNFGDTFSYALSMSAGEPLLFTGRDFELSDIRRVEY